MRRSSTCVSTAAREGRVPTRGRGVARHPEGEGEERNHGVPRVGGPNISRSRISNIAVVSSSKTSSGENNGSVSGTSLR